MIAAIRAEWVLLRRRRFLFGTIGAVCGVAVLGTVLTFMSVGRTDIDGVPVTAAKLARPNGLVAGPEAISILLGVAALSVVAAVLAGDHSHGTLRNQLMAQPHRLRLLAGKSLALASFVVLTVVAAAAIGAISALAMAPLRGVAVGGWLSAAGLGEFGKSVVNMSASTLGFGLLGALVALVFRAPAAAISVGLAYVLPIEVLVSQIYEPSSRWLPAQLLESFAVGGDGFDLTYGETGLRLLCYSAAAAVACILLFRYRDVTV
jgi:hypothetical protein